MLDNVKIELESRIIISYLFIEDTLYNDYVRNGFDLNYLSKVLRQITSFTHYVYYPEINRSELYRQFQKIKDNEDHNNKYLKSSIINGAISEINYNSEVKCMIEYEEKLEKRYPKIKIEKYSKEQLINNYVTLTESELFVLGTHLNENYMKKNPVDAEILCNSINYYETIEYLIKECNDLARIQEFVDNYNEVVSHISKRKIRKYNNKVKKLILKKG